MFLTLFVSDLSSCSSSVRNSLFGYGMGYPENTLKREKNAVNYSVIYIDKYNKKIVLEHKIQHQYKIFILISRSMICQFF